MRETLLSLAETMASSDPVRAKAAKLAMAQQVHAACAPKKSSRDRAPLIKELLEIVSSPRPRLVRAHAARLVGYIGGKGEEVALGKAESDPEIGEDVRMARERIRRTYRL